MCFLSEVLFGKERTLIGFGSIAVDDNGNVYVGELGNMCITKITPDGKLSRAAGQGNSNPDWNIDWRYTEGDLMMRIFVLQT